MGAVRSFSVILLWSLSLFIAVDSFAAEPAAEKAPPEPQTTTDPGIPVEDLESLVKPLTKDELVVEADAWLALLKAKVEEVTAAQLEINRKNRELKATEEVAERAEKAQDALEKVEATATEASKQGDTKATEALADQAAEAKEAVSAVGEAVEQAVEVASETGSDADLVEAKQALDQAESSTEEAAVAARAAEAEADPNTAAESAAETAQAADEAGTAVGQVEDAARESVAESTAALAQTEGDVSNAEEIAELMEMQSKKAKGDVLADLSAIREERTALIDRLNVVLDELSRKIGRTPDGRDPDEVMAYRRYVDSVSGIKLDVSDTQAATATLVGWVTSEQGGLRWAKNFALFIGILVAFWLLGRIFSKGVSKALQVAKVSSMLLRHFLVTSTRRVFLAIGLIMGLSALEVNIGPLLALIGAAGFVVAFALQGTLSNFASGIMIMFYKPFDVGDFVDVAGIAGTVKSMNLVSTTITTVDNKLMVVPNNSIWGNIITNVTGSTERRVDMTFGIGYDDDIAKAEQILWEIVTGHELVLKSPEPVIQLHELADSSVNFVVRPWARTPDYFTVFWDVTRRVKERFDEEGVSIPFPQRDVHVYQAALPAATAAVKTPPQPNGTGRPATPARELPGHEEENDEGRDLPEG